MRFGAGRGASHAIVALLGLGVGAAIFTNGHALPARLPVPASGATPVLLRGGRQCRCGARGCLEAYVGAKPLLAQWRAQPAPRLPRRYNEEEWIGRLITAAGSDNAVGKLFRDVAMYLGIAAANLVNLFNPERIIIGGGSACVLGRCYSTIFAPP